MKIEDLPRPANYRLQMAKNGGYEMVPAYTAEEVLGILEGVEKDAERYRKLQRWMSTNVPEGWREVENMGALCAWESWDAMDDYLDALPDPSVGLMSKSTDAAIKKGQV